MAKNEGAACVHELVENAMAMAAELRNLSLQPNDTEKKMALLQGQYLVTHKLMVGEIKKAQKRPEKSSSENEPVVDKLTIKRDALRKQVYERNDVMKKLIDKMRSMQGALSV
jgi:hypothetical protein